MSACSHLRTACFIELEEHPVCTCHSPQIQAFHDRIMTDCARKQAYGGTGANRVQSPAPIPLGHLAGADASINPMIRLTRLRLFDGTSTLREHVDVLIKGAAIEAIVPAGTSSEDAVVVDCR